MIFNYCSNYINDCAKSVIYGGSKRRGGSQFNSHYCQQYSWRHNIRAFQTPKSLNNRLVLTLKKVQSWKSLGSCLEFLAVWSCVEFNLFQIEWAKICIAFAVKKNMVRGKGASNSPNVSWRVVFCHAHFRPAICAIMTKMPIWRIHASIILR